MGDASFVLVEAHGPTASPDGRSRATMPVQVSSAPRMADLLDTFFGDREFSDPIEPGPARDFEDAPTPVWIRSQTRSGVLSPAVRGEPDVVVLRFEADGFTSEARIPVDRLDEGITVGRHGASEVADALRSLYFGPVSRVHALVRREGRALGVYPVTSGSGIWRGGIPRDRTSLLPGEAVALTPPGARPVYMRWVR